MTKPITLIIEKSAIRPDPDGYPMRAGSLTALKRLVQAGISLIIDTSSLEAGVKNLLKQEAISYTPAADKQSPPPLEPTQTKESSKRIIVKAGSGGGLELKPLFPEEQPSQTASRWEEAVPIILAMRRSVVRERKTRETDISVKLSLDGTGKSEIDTGIPFFDHMLEQISRHGYMDLWISCKGDLEIDEHHTIEDVAITLGEAIGEALGDKRGIGRYGFMVAMDESRSLAAIDLSGRPYALFEGSFKREKVGAFPTEMTSHFFHSLAMSLKATLHISVKGENDHHKIEACFKGFARALRQAVDQDERYRDILPSSKGLL